jgi:transcriptional regulator with XRE-family HTH domain
MARGLGKVIHTLREGRLFTQATLAKKAKVTQGYIAQLERGMRKSPSLHVLQRLAKALGVPVTRLLE